MTEKNPEKQAESPSRAGLTAEELLDKLRSSLQRGGDFPASAKVVNELRILTSDPKTTANQVTEIILREPSLGTRVLHLVNSSFYRRAKPIMTVSQAVIQIGMKPLAELCSGLVLLQKFVPAARRGGPFADCLQKTVLTSLLAGSITSEFGPQGSKNKDEQGYLTGTFSELGTLLLAYYFPKIYEAAAKRAAAKDIEVAESINQLTGLTPTRLSVEVLDALGLPDFYKDTLVCAEKIGNARPAPASTGANDEDIHLDSTRALFAAQKISTAISSGKNKLELDQTLKQVQRALGLRENAFGSLVGKLPEIFREHCSSIELSLPPLPEYVATYSEENKEALSQQAEPEVENKFMQFVEEIREAVEQREPTASIITSVMETFAWSLQFDRVLLMLVDPARKTLHGRMVLGNVDNFDPKELKRPVDERAHRFAPDAVAFKEARPIFNGDPILDDGWPISVIPIGFGQRAIGIIYADRTESDEEEIDAREQAAIGVLAELLDRSIGLNSA